jgi:hypothetical protein
MSRDCWEDLNEEKREFWRSFEPPKLTGINTLLLSA